jgi:hypothetical protein
VMGAECKRWLVAYCGNVFHARFPERELGIQALEISACT